MGSSAECNIRVLGDPWKVIRGHLPKMEVTLKGLMRLKMELKLKVLVELVKVGK